jgi:hypothetical protein
VQRGRLAAYEAGPGGRDEIRLIHHPEEAEVKAKDVGKAGLAGWRETIADKAAPPVAARTPVDEDAIRAVIGGLFFVLSLIYVVGTIKRALEA